MENNLTFGNTEEAVFSTQTNSRLYISPGYLLTNNLDSDNREDFEVSELQQLVRSRIRRRLGMI